LGEAPKLPFSDALGLAAGLGLAFFGAWECCDLSQLEETPKLPFSAALGLAAALCFLLRVGVLCCVVVG
jgi:hypothetical protein